MDGERDVAGLVDVGHATSSASSRSPRELATVISTLGELGYLDASAPARASSRAGPRRGRGTGDARWGPSRMSSWATAVAHQPRSTPPLPAGDCRAGRRRRQLAVARAGRRSRPRGGPELGAAGSQRETVMEFEAPPPPPAEMPYASIVRRPGPMPRRRADQPAAGGDRRLRRRRGLGRPAATTSRSPPRTSRKPSARRRS